MFKVTVDGPINFLSNAYIGVKIGGQICSPGETFRFAQQSLQIRPLVRPNSATITFHAITNILANFKQIPSITNWEQNFRFFYFSALDQTKVVY